MMNHSTQFPTPTVRPSAVASPEISSPAAGLEEELKKLQTLAQGSAIPIRTLIDSLAERGPALAVFLMSAPFIFIPVPGLSTAVGLAVFGLSLAIAVGGKPWIPGFIGRRVISPENLGRLTNGTEKVLRKAQRFVRPRMAWLSAPGFYTRLVGVSLFAATIAFALPLPIPGNNIPPAIGMTLLSLGLIQRDGLLVLIGHIYTALMWVILIVVCILFWGAVSEYTYSLWSRLFG